MRISISWAFLVLSANYSYACQYKRVERSQGVVLISGESIYMCSGYEYRFDSGDFQVLNQNGEIVWNADTQWGESVRLFSSGELTINDQLDGSGSDLWYSGSKGSGWRPFVRFQIDGNIVVYANEGNIWHTGTNFPIKEYFAEKADKQYCYSTIYFLPDGVLRSGVLFSNGREFDGDTLVSRLQIPSRIGGDPLSIVHSQRVHGGFNVDGAREETQATTVSLDGSYNDFDWDSASFTCGSP